MSATRPGMPRGGSRIPPEPSPDPTPPGESRSEALQTETRTSGRRPGGTSRRIGPTGRTASWRVVVLILVLMMAIAVILPSLRAYSRQNERLGELRAEAAAAEEEVAALEAELARWQDPAYVVAQARERLIYVLPGETPYRVIDPETVTGGATDPSTPEPLPIRDGVPWYLTLWDSVANPEAP